MKTHKIASPLEAWSECGKYGIVYNYDASTEWTSVTCPDCLNARIAKVDD